VKTEDGGREEKGEEGGMKREEGGGRNTRFISEIG